VTEATPLEPRRCRPYDRFAIYIRRGAAEFLTTGGGDERAQRIHRGVPLRELLQTSGLVPDFNGSHRGSRAMSSVRPPFGAELNVAPMTTPPSGTGTERLSVADESRLQGNASPAAG
jgi:hypothetical protein